jgi:hypothetical protein
VHLECEAAVRCFAVEVLCEVSKPDVFLSQAINGAHHLDQGSSKSVKLPDHENIFGTKEVKCGLELRTLRSSLARFRLEDALTACREQSITLKI